MSKRNTEARDAFFTKHLDEQRVKEVFSLSERDFCKLFYNNSKYESLRSMGERFEELALREKGGYLASYYLITIQDLICSHIIANIGEELINNHNFEVKVSKSCVQLTTESKQYFIHGLMGNPEVSTWLGVENAPIEAIQNNHWKATIFDLMNNAITAGPSFFIAHSLIYDNIQAFELHAKDTRQNHSEKKYFEKILAKRTEIEEEDEFSFPTQSTNNSQTVNAEIKTIENTNTQQVDIKHDTDNLNKFNGTTHGLLNPIEEVLFEEAKATDKNNSQNQLSNDTTKVVESKIEKNVASTRIYSQTYAEYKKEYAKNKALSEQANQINTSSHATENKTEPLSDLASPKKTYPNKTKPYYKKPYNPNYKKNYPNKNSATLSNGETGEKTVNEKIEAPSEITQENTQHYVKNKM